MIELICEWGVPRSLAQALEQVNATHEIGAQFSKWQMFDPKRLASKDAMRYWARELGGDDKQLATFRRAKGLDEREWARVWRECDKLGVEPLVTPFDLEAVDRLEELGVSAYKIASGDITYKPLIEKVAATGKRVFLSTGASELLEVSRAVGWLDGCKVTALACDLVYPCPASDADLSRIPALPPADFYGYSDHTREVVTGAVAVSLGATVLEKHTTLSPEGDSPDDKMALTVDKAKTYRKLAEQAYSLCQPVIGDPEILARIGARRSAYATRALSAGQTVRASDIVWLRPCPEGGIEPHEDIVGERLGSPVGMGERIDRGDFV